MRLLSLLLLVVVLWVPVQAAPPAAPSNLVVTTNSPFTFSLRWRDNANNESHFIVGVRQAGTGGTYNPLGNALAANITNFVAAGLMTPNITNEVSVFAFNTNNEYSSSTPVLVRMPPFPAPTNVTAKLIGPTSVRLTWKDNTTNEAGFYVGYRLSTNEQFSLHPVGDLAPNVTNLVIHNLLPARTYQFVIQANHQDAFAFSSVLSSFVSTNTPNGFTSLHFHPAVVGEPIEPYVLVPTTTRGAPSSYTLSGTLPPGLTYDAATHTLSGTPTQAGVFKPLMVATYPGEGSVTNPLSLRVIHPVGAPVVTTPIPAQSLATNGPPVQISLGQHFNDPDTERAMQVFCNYGNFKLALYPTATPQTVSNFLNYVNRGDYSNSVFHRAPTHFVVQGGGFKLAGSNFTAIVTDPSPTNEPGVQHVRGTVAMAKLGTDPNSATSQWFVNLKDNSLALDEQNGGFTAFGRVLGDGMSVFDGINLLPKPNYTIPVGGQPTLFENVPVNAVNAPATFDPATAVLVQSITRIDTLMSYAVTSNTLPAVASAVVQGGTNLVLTPLTAFGGITTVTVTATDLDGNSQHHSFTVSVNSPYTGWLTQQGLSGTNSLPGADPDGDKLSNGAEFLLMGQPGVAETASQLASRSWVNVGPDRYLALTFKLRKAAGGAVALLRVSTTLASGSWNTVWTSTDLAGPQVVQQLDQGDYWLVTVRDNTPVSAGAPHRFLNLQVQVPP